MLQITRIEEVNRKLSQESLRLILKNANGIKDYTTKETLQDAIIYIIDRFEEEVNIDTFNDINDYVEYFIENLRDIYPNE